MDSQDCTTSDQFLRIRIRCSSLPLRIKYWGLITSDRISYLTTSDQIFKVDTSNQILMSDHFESDFPFAPWDQIMSLSHSRLRCMPFLRSKRPNLSCAVCNSPRQTSWADHRIKHQSIILLLKILDRRIFVNKSKIKSDPFPSLFGCKHVQACVNTHLYHRKTWHTSFQILIHQHLPRHPNSQLNSVQIHHDPSPLFLCTHFGLHSPERRMARQVLTRSEFLMFRVPYATRAVT